MREDDYASSTTLVEVSGMGSKNRKEIEAVERGEEASMKICGVHATIVLLPTIHEAVFCWARIILS